MAWTNGPLVVYHGTIAPYAAGIRRNGIRLARCLPKADFSRGFYTTRIRAQAEIFANWRYHLFHAQHVYNGLVPDPMGAAMVEFSVHLDALASLESLAFVQPTPDWVEFVNHCRSPSDGHRGLNVFYDVVYGPVSNQRAESISHHEQLSFHSDYAISLLSLVDVHIGAPTL